MVTRTLFKSCEVADWSVQFIREAQVRKISGKNRNKKQGKMVENTQVFQQYEKQKIKIEKAGNE